MVGTIIAIGLTVASAIYQAKKANDAKKAAKAAGVQAREAANSQADLQDWNASIARLQAADAIERGKEAEERFRQGVKLQIGSMRAGFAAENVDVGFGSAVDTVADAAYLGELDALQIRTNAAREAWGFNVQAEDYAKRATIARKEGVYLEAGANQQAAQIQGQMIGGLLQTGSSLFAQRYGFSSPSGGSTAGTAGTGSTNFNAGTASFAATAPTTSTYAGAFRGVRF